MNNFNYKILWKRVVGDLEKIIDNPFIYDDLLDCEIDVNNDEITIKTFELPKKIIEENIDLFQESTFKHFNKNLKINFKVKNYQHNNVDNLEKKVVLPIPNVDKKNSVNKLISQYSFENLIIHDGNKKAINVGIEFLNPNNNINTCFFHGGVGVGKTHLVIALIKMLEEKHPEKKSLYINSYDLSQKYYNYLNNNDYNQDMFVDNFKNFDFVVIDDFQNFQKKENINQMLFLIVEILIKTNSKVIFVSHNQQKDLEYFDKSLRSRVLSGFICQILAPDLKATQLIVEKYLEKESPNIKFDDIAMEYLCFLLGNDVRIAIGKLINIIFSVGKPNELKIINKNNLDEILKTLNIQKEFSKLIKVQDNSQLKNICKKLDVAVDDIVGKSRRSELVKKRNITIYILKKSLKLSHIKIGELLNRDHSTVSNSLKMIENEIKINSEFKHYLESLTMILNLQ